MTIPMLIPFPPNALRSAKGSSANDQPATWTGRTAGRTPFCLQEGRCEITRYLKGTRNCPRFCAQNKDPCKACEELKRRALKNFRSRGQFLPLNAQSCGRLRPPGIVLAL